MKQIILILALLLTTLSYSQRNLKTSIEYNKYGKPVTERQTKFSYWINSKDKFIIELEAGMFTYTIKSEEKKVTTKGEKYTQFDLELDNAPEDANYKSLIIQEFENKEYGIMLYSKSNNNTCYLLKP